LDISAKGTVDGNEVSLGEGNEDLLAPLPNVYATGAYGFTDRLVFRCGGGWMSLTYGDYDGELVFANAFIEYWPFKYFGFGAGYKYTSVDVNYDSGKKKENYEATLPGPTIYLKVGF
jgi:hypothetical protein